MPTVCTADPCGHGQTKFSLCRPWQRCEREKGHNLSPLGFYTVFLHPWGSHFLRRCNICQILIGDIVVHGWLTLGQLLPQRNAPSNTRKSSFLVDSFVTWSFVETEDKNYSCVVKILSHSIINCRVVFLCLMSVKAHGCSALLKLDLLDLISSSHQYTETWLQQAPCGDRLGEMATQNCEKIHQKHECTDSLNMLIPLFTGSLGVSWQCATMFL